MLLRRFLVGCTVASLCMLYSDAWAQFSQQGPKLVGTGGLPGYQYQGSSVALSADGNTAIVGGPADNSSFGATWVFTRAEGVWTQQGAKLVGTGSTGAAQGSSVALSADGNTAIVGGPGDNGSAGAAWVFTRSSGVWTQQGAKLVGTGGGARQGISVALSADGNTAIVGGAYDTFGVGGAWVFTRAEGVWTQQGARLVGTGAVGAAHQGISVALSADGNTAIVGGFADTSDIGATWVFTRAGGIWTQQGAKLVGTGAVGAAHQGVSVALSAYGNTAIIGGWTDNNDFGATWVFRRSGGVWTQQGAKLVGSGFYPGDAQQGASVALSADGSTAIVGAPIDGPVVGAVWVFTGPAETASVVEYYYAAADEYFISADPTEISALDNNRFPGWVRTGMGFGAYASATAGASPVCRFFIPPASHFYSASPAECAATRQKFPGLAYESGNVFYIALPDTATGACPAGTIPVYRLFDNRADPNHRYTTSTAIVDQMRARGWIPEGYGPGPYYPIMCAPSS